MPEENEEQIEEESAEKSEEVKSEGGRNFFSPEVVMIFLIAGFLDLIGAFLFVLSLFGIGIPISWIFDLVGFIIIGGWMFMRSGRITITKAVKKTGTKFLKRLGLASLGEIIPFFGDIAPCWIAAVYLELKNG